MISIVVPVLNEASTIKNSLERLSSLKGDYEIIVVDGGSRDDTVSIASQYCKVVNSDKGRGKQLHLGAQIAKGDILWFVHSDSRIELNSLSAINMACQSVSAGCFSLRFYDACNFNFLWLAWTSNLRAKYLKLMYGDQGIFVKKDTYYQVGGFDDIPIMEDWRFSRQLSKHEKLCVLKDGIGTSGRRFTEGGFFKTLLKMHWIKWKYIRGCSPEKLITYYREIR